MADIVNKVFRYFVFIFLFLVFLEFDYLIDFLYVNSMMVYMINILVLIALLSFVRQLDKWMATLNDKLPIQLMTIFLLLLFSIHEIFTPYFYTENYLKKTGLEKIEIYHQLSNDELSEDERSELAEDAMIKVQSHAYSVGQYPVDPIENIEIIDIRRNYYQYELVVIGKYKEQKKTYNYTFEKEGFAFKISGFTQQN